MVEVFGYACAILMGLSLGLIGGGGSILTVPILVYLFSIDAVMATGYSLFIVGFTSLIGSFSHIRMGNVHLRTAVVFGIPSIIAVFITRAFIVPAIPQDLFNIGTLQITKPIALLLLFAVIMLLASYSMIRRKKQKPDYDKVQYNYPLIIIEGFVVGTITGLVGAGGGFLIVPALVLLAHLPMKKAIGSSLLIIATNSLLGFSVSLFHSDSIDWHLLLTFSAIAILGIIIGSLMSKKISNEKLKPAFGWFVLIMGIYIILKETLLK